MNRTKTYDEFYAEVFEKYEIGAAIFPKVFWLHLTETRPDIVDRLIHSRYYWPNQMKMSADRKNPTPFSEIELEVEKLWPIGTTNL